MPWQETRPMNERTKLAMAYLAGTDSMVALCDEYGISTKTGFKWLRRFVAQGHQGMRDVSKAPHRVPHKTSDQVEEALVVLKLEFPKWGPKKLVNLMTEFFPHLTPPAPSTAGEILKRCGLVTPCPQRRRTELRRATHLVNPSQPNDTWGADYKGNFFLRDGSPCYPLTVTDGFSRFILACKGMSGIDGRPAKKVFQQLFIEHGLPLRIRTDNGSPFGANRGLALSKLSLWWMRLGIVHERIEAGRPQQNGRHERMHATLSEVTHPPRANAVAQQEAFDDFVEEFNHQRPHEALDMKKPASLYTSSPRQMPKELPPLEYPPHFDHRTIGGNGRFFFQGFNPFISKVLATESVGLEALRHDCFRIWAGTLPLGFIDLQRRRFYAYDEEQQKSASTSSPMLPV